MNNQKTTANAHQSGNYAVPADISGIDLQVFSFRALRRDVNGLIVSIGRALSPTCRYTH